jgi:AraC-like DNA-binding protein
MSIIDLSLGQTQAKTDPLFSRQVQEARRFVQETRRPRSNNVVVIGGFERVDRNYAIEGRKFPLLGIEFVVGGRGEVHLNKGRFELNPGMMFSYRAHTPHDIWTDPRRPLAKYFVSISDRAGYRLLQSAGFEPNTAWQTSRPADLQRLFDELIVHGARGESSSGLVCDQLLRTILILAAGSRLPANASRGEAFDTYERCSQILDGQALQLRTLKDAAKSCNVSVEYLCRLFQRYEGRSPYQRLLRAKMSCAATLLRSGNALIKDVAAELGYSDPFHFSRVFKRVFGCPPTSVRGVNVLESNAQPQRK